MNSKASDLCAASSLAVTEGWLDVAEERGGLAVRFYPATSSSKGLVLAGKRLARS